MDGEIITESYVYRGGELVPTGALSDAERGRLARWLKMTYLNELYRGRAEIRPEEETARQKPKRNP